MSPKISVVMSVYNDEKYLREAIESILNQTFTDFEFIVVDDGSSDGSADIIKSYKDPRIRFFKHENHGLVYSLNRGIREGSGEYIARMDADDISLPQRLEKQVGFLEKHTDIGIVGTWAIKITEEGEDIYIAQMPQSDLEARELLAKSSPFFHGSVMFRRALFDSCGPYPEAMKEWEDWILWHQFAAKTKLANIGEALYKHRKRSNAPTNWTSNDIKRLRNISYKYLQNKRISLEDESFFESFKSGRGNKKSEAYYWLVCGKMFLEIREDHLKARDMLKKSLLLYPYNMRAIVNLFYTFLPPNTVSYCKTHWKRLKSFIQS